MSSQSKAVSRAIAMQTDETPNLAGIYRAELRHIWNLLRFLGVPSKDLEDVTHDVFLTVCRRLSSFDPQRPMRPWITGIARRVASDYRRRAYNYREVGVDELQAIEPRRDAEGQLGAKEAHADVLRALDALSFDQRTVFVLYEIDEQPAVEIATMLDLPLNTVYTRLRRARRRFTRAVRVRGRKRGEP